jgi:hypothetical protein
MRTNKHTSLLFLIVVVTLLLVAPCCAAMYSFSPSQAGYITGTYRTQNYTLQLNTAPTAGPSITSVSSLVLGGSVSKYFETTTRAYLTYDTSSLSGLCNESFGITDASIRVNFAANNSENLCGDNYGASLVLFSPSSPSSVVREDWSNFGLASYQVYDVRDYAGSGYVYLPIYSGIINSSGYTSIGFISEYDRLSSLNPSNPSFWPDNNLMTTSSKRFSFSFTGNPATSYNTLYITLGALPPTPTPTPSPAYISVNLMEKYSNAALVNQAITVTPTEGGAGETKTSLYGETLHFGVVPGMEYWFNASRTGYQDYNETYTIPDSPGIYNVYMERILTPIANHSYAHFSVVDQTNGGLIPNAEIRLSDGQTKLTNSAGYAWFSVNNSEQINYYVSKQSGYWPAYGALNISADESITVALQRYSGPTATQTLPGWTPVTVPTTGTGVNPVVTLSAQLRQQNVQEGMDVWYTNLPFISQFLFLLFIIGGLGLMAGGTRRN